MNTQQQPVTTAQGASVATIESNVELSTKVNRPKSAKVKANEAYKKDMFSLSGLIRYCKSDKGNEILTKYVTTKGYEFNLSKLSTKFITSHATERELKDKQGNDKVKFSFWLVLTCIDRANKS